MPRSADPNVRRVVRTYADTVLAVRSRVTQFVEQVWRSLPAYRDNDIERFAAAVIPVVIGGQRQVAALTDAYLTTLARVVLGSSKPVGVSPQRIGIEQLRGVPAAEVYARPGVTVWMALQSGVPFPQAVNQGLQRAVSLAQTDMQLAKTHTARQSLTEDPRVVGYERIADGENPCGLCLVASTQRYHKADLLPIHPGCWCDVEPIYGTKDPGRIINEQRLDDTHAAIKERFGATTNKAEELRAIQIRQHGELGPVLTIRDHNFTGPAHIP